MKPLNSLFKALGTLPSILALTVTAAVLLAEKVVPQSPTPRPPQFPVPSPLLVSDEQAIATHAARSLTLAHPRNSLGRNTVIQSLLARIALDTFETQEQRRLWIALIGIESGYDGAARSSTGAVGLGQLLPRYAADFGADCGLSAVTATDLQDDATNATLSACYFRWLLKMHHGNSSLALVSYVSGPYSEDVAKARKGQPTSKTAHDYVRNIHAKKAKAEGAND